jgi:hypothetical protein
MTEQVSERKFVKFNLTNYIRVRLTDVGWAYFMKHHQEKAELYATDRTVNDFTLFQAIEFIEIFGGMMAENDLYDMPCWADIRIQEDFLQPC